MGRDLGWMVGRSFTEISIQEGPSWTFRVGDEAELRANSPWRLVSGGWIVLSSEDHGQRYGWPRPLDAEAECHKRLIGSVIRSAEIRDETRDLSIVFESGDRLEIIPLSSGYESWQIAEPGGDITIAQGGGNLVGWRPDA